MAAAEVEQNRRQTVAASLAWLEQRANVYEQFGVVTAANAVAALEELRMDQVVFMRGFADLIRVVVPM